MNTPPNPEGNKYVTVYQSPQRSFPYWALLVAVALLGLGWIGHDFHDQDTVLPTQTPVPTAVPTVEQPDVAKTVVAEIAAQWTPTSTPTLVPTIAPTNTMTITEQKLATLPYCDTLLPTDPPQECILYNPLIAPTVTPFPTQTAVPTCPENPIRSSIQSICVHEPSWADFVTKSLWR